MCGAVSLFPASRHMAGDWHSSRRRLPSMTDFGSPSGTDIDLFISISENCTDTLKQLYDRGEQPTLTLNERVGELSPIDIGYWPQRLVVRRHFLCG